MKTSDWVVVKKGCQLATCRPGTVGKVVRIYDIDGITYAVIKVIRHVGSKIYLHNSDGIFRLPKDQLKIVFARTTRVH